MRMPRSCASLVLLAAVAAPSAMASERAAFHDRWFQLAAVNRAGAAAALDFLACNEEAARKLSVREDFVPRKLRPIEAEAAEAGAQCTAEEGALAAAVTASELQQLKAIVRRINVEKITRLRQERDRPFVCAHAEWAGCSMRPIPEWK